MKTLYIFNPESDMALASGSPYYMTPERIKRMAMDLCALPAWYADRGDTILLAKNSQVEWMVEESPVRPDCKYQLAICPDCDKVSPWGWNASIVHRLKLQGMSADKLLSSEEIEKIRHLSSRRTAVELLPLLRFPGTIGESVILSSVEEVKVFVATHPRVLLKEPWSGSGRGLQSVEGSLSVSMEGWVRRVIVSQGFVVGEPYYNKRVDFAMEFWATDEEVTFGGYSVFETDVRGLYKGNMLRSDEALESILSGFVSLDLLHAVRSALLSLLKVRVCGHYAGCLGVDMMICLSARGDYVLHPCVEVNLRMNMGMVARVFFDRYVCPDASGRFVIEYFNVPGDAYADCMARRCQHPLVVESGRIRNGYLSLTPVDQDTKFQAYVEIGV